MNPADAPARSHVIVRQPLPAPPERVFDLFCQGEQLQQWFCDDAESDPQLNGEVHAQWQDEDGQMWARVGRWQEFERPHVLALEWFAVQTADNPDATPQPSELLRIGIAPHENGSFVTVVSPLLTAETPIRAQILHDAARMGWEATFQALRELLQAEGA